MKPSRLSVCLASLAALLALPAAAQDDAAPSDNVVMLPCDGKCPTVTRNVRSLKGSSPSWPSSMMRGGISEAIVELHYTIGADGKVGDDVTVLQLVGPPEFADAAKRAVRNYVYQPALVDGAPVAIAHTLRVIFQYPGIEQGARSTIVAAYDKAVSLLKEGKLDEGEAVLNQALQQPHLVFYERGMIANLLAVIALQRKDFIRARGLTDLALIFPPDDLPLAVRRSLMRANIVAALNLGDIAGAGKMIGRLNRLPSADPADPLISEFADLRRKIDALDSFSAPAAIPAEGEDYQFYLYRRNFAFTNVKGELKSVTVSCDQQETTSPISLKAEWSVPKSWSDCSLFIRGTAGTSFNIVQFAAEKPATNP